LLPRGAGPYKVLAKINDNAYKIVLPIVEYGVSNSFNAADLTPYEGEDIAASRSTPFEGGRMMRTSLSHHHYLLLLLMMKMLLRRSPRRLIRIGPITRARAKLLEQQVNSLLIELDLLFNESFILPKSMHLCMIKFVDNTSIARGGDASQRDEQDLMIKCVREEREAGAPGDHQNIKST
jgi:hypothetical protein